MEDGSSCTLLLGSVAHEVAAPEESGMLERRQRVGEGSLDRPNLGAQRHSWPKRGTRA